MCYLSLPGSGFTDTPLIWIHGHNRNPDPICWLIRIYNTICCCCRSASESAMDTNSGAGPSSQPPAQVGLDNGHNFFFLGGGNLAGSWENTVYGIRVEGRPPYFDSLQMATPSSIPSANMVPMVNFLKHLAEFFLPSGWWVEASPISFSRGRGMEPFKKKLELLPGLRTYLFVTDPDQHFQKCYIRISKTKILPKM